VEQLPSRGYPRTGKKQFTTSSTDAARRGQAKEVVRLKQRRRTLGRILCISENITSAVEANKVVRLR
jgi:hypothetical protein